MSLFLGEEDASTGNYLIKSQSRIDRAALSVVFKQRAKARALESF